MTLFSTVRARRQRFLFGLHNIETKCQSRWDTLKKKIPFPREARQKWHQVLSGVDWFGIKVMPEKKRLNGAETFFLLFSNIWFARGMVKWFINWVTGWWNDVHLCHVVPCKWNETSHKTTQLFNPSNIISLQSNNPHKAFTGCSKCQIKCKI